MTRATGLLLAVLAAAFFCRETSAEPATPKDRRAVTAQPAKSAEPPQASGSASRSQPIVPDEYRMNLLIRTTIIAINQANRTGNYTVLRDLGSPAFQTANTAALLGELFANQRKANLDFSPILFFDPKLVAKPFIDEAGRLRLTGFFPTSPQQVNFDLAFEHVEGEWRHFALGVGTQLVANAP